MAEYLGRTYTKGELLERVGDMSQICGAIPSTITTGRATGVQIIDVRTGSGLHATVVPSRCMDIAWADFQGVPLSFVSKTGLCSPFLYESDDDEFLRNFYAGLLTTCGLLNTGPPSTDMGTRYKMHGRISNIPAHDVAINHEWRGDDYAIEVAGKVRLSKLYEENLLLTRSIRTALGSSSLEIRDRIDNEGFRTEELMILYHFNFGFPLLTEHSVMLTSPGVVTPRDATAEAHLSLCKSMDPPTDDWPETVFFHRLKPGGDGLAHSVLFNPTLGESGLGVVVSFDPSELGWLVEWKQMGKGDYVLAMEPATHPPVGRNIAREQGGLKRVEPGESCEFVLRVGVVSGTEEIEGLVGPI